MRYQIRWSNSAEAMQFALKKMSGDHRRLCALLGVSRSFVEMMLRGEKPIPAHHAYVLGKLHKIMSFERFMSAHLADVAANYVEDGERHAKGTQKLL